MFSRLTRMTYLAAAASLLLSGPVAMASSKEPSCAQLENSFLPAPSWYAERCLAGNAVTDYSQYKEVRGLVPGDIAFYKDNFPNNTVLSAPLPTLTFATIGANAQPLFAFTFNPSATTIYAIDNTSRQLGTVNQTTGAFTSIAVVTGPAAGDTVTGLAFDPTAAATSAYAVYTDGATAKLFTVNVSTAVATLVGNIAGFPLVIDIVVDSTGQMFGHDIGVDQLIRINKATGAPTTVGPTGLAANFAQGMMYDQSDDTIYGCAFVTAPAQQGELVRFNKTTGAATVVAGPVPNEMECGVKRAGGPCTGPIFSGITSATNGGTSSCAVNLAWAPATACGSTTIKYNVYRSTTPGTAPSAATLLQSCITGLTYTDTTATSGTRYYYIVRAEDNTSSGNGACNSGIQDGNTTEASAVPTGPITAVTDDVESGGAQWDTSGGNGANTFAIVTTQAHSPTHSWFTQDLPVVTLQPLRRIAPVAVPAGGGQISWWHRVDTESTFDGYVLDYSLDGGTTWTDILAAQGPVAANPNRFTLNGYNSTLSTGFNNPLPGRRAWSGAILTFQEVRVDMADFAGRSVSFRFLSGTDNSVSITGLWIDDISVGTNGTCSTVPQQGAAPSALAVDAAGNGVYQPNETVIVAPTWRNTGATAITLAGALTNHTGPAGPTYSIPDGTAAYASIAVGGTGSCGSNCYSVANTAATRPILHWDSTALETVTPTGATKTWTLHIGDSFTDVPASNGFYRFIETILHKGVTGGCTATTYCPSNSTTRDQMAVFVLVAKEPAGFNPPACVAGSEMFADVPASSPFCKWIEELARRGVVSGCGGGNYCPTSAATREQMSVFVLRTLDGTLNPVACVAGSEMFTDVPASSPFCKWIEELVRRGVVTGCGAGIYCPTAVVTREQMAVFLTVTFGLTLYGL